MASLRAHLFTLMVGYGVKLRLGPEPDIAALRAVWGGGGFAPTPEAVYAPDSLGGVPGERVEPRGNGEGGGGLGGEDLDDGGPSGGGLGGSHRPRLLYLHGGGYVACSPRTHRPITGAFARAGFSVFAPDYRLAPEHPFPAAIEDALRVWQALSAQGPAMVAGDSAGGNLTLALLTEAKRRGLPMPIAAALFSPSTDYTGRGASYRENARRDAMFRPEVLLRLIPAYLGGADPRDPRISALEADLSGLPPLLIHVGRREMLRDDSVLLAERAGAAGVRVALSVWPVVPHAWQLAESFLPEARQSLDEAAAFLRAEWAREAPGRAPAPAVPS